MTSSKHDPNQAGEADLADDLERNPGIGESKGAFAATGEDPQTAEGDNTVEGDVENDAGLGQGANPAQLGRTNS
ncbi:MAG TPA: hypothetical protein VIL42_01600 [Sphingomicrobium sp.]|jgi:hypothetical protein